MMNIEHFKTFYILRLELLLLKFWLGRSFVMLFMHFAIISPYKDKHGMKKPITSVPQNASASLYVWLKSSSSSCIKCTVQFNANHKKKSIKKI